MHGQNMGWIYSRSPQGGTAAATGIHTLRIPSLPQMRPATVLPATSRSATLAPAGNAVSTAQVITGPAGLAVVGRAGLTGAGQPAGQLGSAVIPRPPATLLTVPKNAATGGAGGAAAVNLAVVQQVPPAVNKVVLQAPSPGGGKGAITGISQVIKHTFTTYIFSFHSNEVFFSNYVRSHAF